MSRWPSEQHFTSWLKLAPNNKISGGRLLSSRTQPSANRAAAIFRVSAMSLARTNTALGAFSRRLAARIGKAKAITATAHKLACLIYRILRFGTEYVDRGQDYYERRYQHHLLSHLTLRARQLGYTLVKTENPSTMATRP